MDCNIQLVRHYSVSGMVCVCRECGEPYPTWPTHTHECVRSSCPTYRPEVHPHWHVNPTVRLCNEPCPRP